MSRDRTSDEQTPIRRGPNPPTPSEDTSRFDSRFGPRWALARRELRSLRSEKTILLALAIQLVIAGFSSFLVVGLVSLYDPGAAGGHEVTIYIEADDPGDQERLVELANEQDGIQAVLPRENRPDLGYRGFENGGIDAVLGVTRDDDGRLHVEATVPDEGLKTTIVVVQLQEYLQTVEHEERLANADVLETTPVTVPDGIEASPYVEFTYTILLPLLLFLPVFISGSIVVDSIIEERSRGTLELLRVSPLSLIDIVDAKLLAIAALAPVQAIVWLFLLAWNGTTIATPTALVVLVSALSLTVVTIGAGIALVTPDRRQAQLSYSVGIVSALVLATALPEHPANTVAKFAIGNATTTTWLLLAGYCLVAAGVFVVVRTVIGEHETDSV